LGYWLAADGEGRKKAPTGGKRMNRGAKIVQQPGGKSDRKEGRMAENQRYGPKWEDPPRQQYRNVTSTCERTIGWKRVKVSGTREARVRGRRTGKGKSPKYLFFRRKINAIVSTRQ